MKNAPTNPTYRQTVALLPIGKEVWFNRKKVEVEEYYPASRLVRIRLDDGTSCDMSYADACCRLNETQLDGLLESEAYLTKIYQDRERLYKESKASLALVKRQIRFAKI